MRTGSYLVGMNGGLRILMVTDGLAPWVTGGMQQHSAMLAAHLAAFEVQLTLVHCGQINGPVPDATAVARDLSLPESVRLIGVPFRDTGRLPGHYVRASKQYSAAVRHAVGDPSQFDVVYAQGFTGWAFADHPRLVVNLHGLEMFQPAFTKREAAEKALLRPAARRVLRSARSVVSLGGRLSGLVEACGVPASAIVEIPNGIPDKWLNGTPLARKDGPLRALFIGRNEMRKGFDLLLQAMPRVSGPVDWEVVGPFDAVDAGAVRPHFHGEIRSRARLMEILDEADVLVVPSRAEGMPTVILEALSRGCHVIATDVGATAELLVDAPGCRLIAPDVDELVRAVEAFAADPPLPRVFNLDRFSWNRVAEDHLRLFERLAARG